MEPKRQKLAPRRDLVKFQGSQRHQKMCQKIRLSSSKNNFQKMTTKITKKEKMEERIDEFKISSNF